MTSKSKRFLVVSELESTSAFGEVRKDAGLHRVETVYDGFEFSVHQALTHERLQGRTVVAVQHL